TMRSDFWFVKAYLKSLILVFVLGLSLTNARAGDNIEFNRRATAKAQILAGISPVVGDPAIERLPKLEAFAEHEKWMASQWSQVRNRISATESWRAHEVKIQNSQNRTLLYPFSGPDFLNAYILFPDLTRAYDAPDATQHPRRIMRSVRIDFVGANGGTPQQLYYISLDATDKALEFYPGFLDWVGQHRPATALLKSASYLLHDNQF